jgi:hypothetical protein
LLARCNISFFSGRSEPSWHCFPDCIEESLVGQAYGGTR